MKLKVEEEIKTKLQLEAENRKVHYVNNKQKIDKNFSCLDLEKKSKREKRECVS